MIKEEWKINKYETEDQFQSASILMISQQFPKLRGKVFHVSNEWYLPKPNETYLKKLFPIVLHSYIKIITAAFGAFVDELSIRFGSKNKSKGLLAGVPDILIIYHGIIYKIELKQPDGKLSDSQRELHEIWNRDCPEVPVKICYTVYEVYEYCKWIIETDLMIDFIQPHKFKF